MVKIDQNRISYISTSGQMALRANTISDMDELYKMTESERSDSFDDRNLIRPTVNTSQSDIATDARKSSRLGDQAQSPVIG